MVWKNNGERPKAAHYSASFYPRYFLGILVSFVVWPLFKLPKPSEVWWVHGLCSLRSLRLPCPLCGLRSLRSPRLPCPLFRRSMPRISRSKNRKCGGKSSKSRQALQPIQMSSAKRKRIPPNNPLGAFGTAAAPGISPMAPRGPWAQSPGFFPHSPRVRDRARKPSQGVRRDQVSLNCGVQMG